jgi:hypothetical protein
MPLLHIALQEGFSDDTVVVRVNGNEVLRQAGISTRLQIGFAASVEKEVAGSTADLTVDLPQRSLSKSMAIPLAGSTYVGVSVEPQGIVFKISIEPFGYL